MEYTKLLISIGKLISDSELLAMKFICREFEGRKTLEEIETPLDLWNVLEQRLKLSADNMTFLKSMLLQINREDLAALVDEYSKSINNAQPEPHNLIGQDSVPVQETGPDLSAEFTYLTKHVGREWKMFARSLGLSDGDIDCIEDDYARNLREQIRQSLNYWKNENRTEATKESLIRALRQAQLNLLADNIESEKY